MNKEQLRMQMLAGIITEDQYKVKSEKSKKSLSENEPSDDSLNEGAYKDSFKKWLEATIDHVNQADKKGKLTWSHKEELVSWIDDVWFYIENGGENKYKKNLESILGYKLPAIELSPDQLKENIAKNQSLSSKR